MYFVFRINRKLHKCFSGGPCREDEVEKISSVLQNMARSLVLSPSDDSPERAPLVAPRGRSHSK